MNKYLIGFLLLIGMAFYACDEIEGPYIKESSIVDGKYQFPERTTFVKKALIEEFTGHKCVNCPMGHAEVKTIMEKHPDQVISVAIHAGFFAKTSSSVFTTDFTTNTGEALYQKYGSPSVPSAVVNRKGGVKTRDEWAASIATSLTEQQLLDLQIHKEEESNSMTVFVQAESLISDIKNINVAVYLLESKIIAPQKDGSVTIDDYEHNHVLRKGITEYTGVSYWGNELVQKGTKLQKAFKVDLDANWNKANLHVVAFAINDAGEIIQAEEI